VINAKTIKRGKAYRKKNCLAGSPSSGEGLAFMVVCGCLNQG